MDDPADAVLELSGFQRADLVIEATSGLQATADAVGYRVAASREAGKFVLTPS